MISKDGLVRISFHLFAEYIAFTILRVYIAHYCPLAFEVVHNGIIHKLFFALGKGLLGSARIGILLKRGGGYGTG